MKKTTACWMYGQNGRNLIEGLGPVTIPYPDCPDARYPLSGADLAVGLAVVLGEPVQVEPAVVTDGGNYGVYIHVGHPDGTYSTGRESVRPRQWGWTDEDGRYHEGGVESTGLVREEPAGRTAMPPERVAVVTEAVRRAMPQHAPACI